MVQYLIFIAVPSSCNSELNRTLENGYAKEHVVWSEALNVFKTRSLLDTRIGSSLDLRQWRPHS